MNATLTQTETSIADALAALNARRATFDTLKREADELFQKISPARINAPTPSLADSLRARARQADNANALVLAAADIEDAEKLVSDLREIDRTARTAAIRERQRPIVAELMKSLDKAAAVNAKLSALDEDLAANGVADRLAWHELLPDAPTCPSRLDTWRAALRERGLLD